MRIKKNRKSYYENVAAYIFLSLWILGMLIFYLFPFLYSLYLSFTDSNLVGGSLTGVTNYIRLFTEDNRFMKSLSVTTKYAFIGVPLKLIFALFLAVILQKGSTYYRTAFYLPSLIGSSVAVAVMWRQLFGKSGIFSAFLLLFGIPSKNWIGSPGTALSILVVLCVWQFGSSMVVFIGGLKNVPDQLYEAARIDGSGKTRQFFSITLPILSPTIQFNLILQLVGGFQVFTQGYIITRGGPMDSTLFTVQYIYEQAFKSAKLGYASSMSWVLFLLISVVSMVVLLSSKYWVFYEND